ncbi:uncharacterized protein LOC127254930 [Andrographis paniculata]|uniref:uncharacterized protein LOC127254930 n=1 Tax=Andrographis paniculata TaxID=175694 RepID=UPI0021E89CB9|nr:uncharacterized protein LOC127254930 [Andrographis paniculata]
MSVQFPEGLDSSRDLQVWNNAAFDNGEIPEDPPANKQSWGSLKPIFENPNASFDSVTGKENQVLVNQIPSPKSSLIAPFKPVNKLDKSNVRVLREKGGICESPGVGKQHRDDKVIDNEIEEIESEILRLNLRLEALKIEKAERRGCTKSVERRGKVVPAKFMEPKNSPKIEEEKRQPQIDEFPSRTKISRRGYSLGPAEIARKAVAAETFGPPKLRNLGRPEMNTPLSSRRKSCFWKMQDIAEDKVAVTKARGQSSSVSPKSRKVAAKSQVVPRQAVTTIASRKTVKKEDSIVNAIQPKKLFKEGEKSAPGTNKKGGMRTGRIVASRYNQGSALRKRSLPEENDKDDGKRCDKKRSLSAGKSRVKKRWEIPNEIIVHGSVVETVALKSTPEPVIGVPSLLPRIRIARCTNDSPRDSGPAKKVAELSRRKSFFSNDEDDEEEDEEGNPSIFQTLDYPEEDDDDYDER